jgi:hypothetical protein
MKDLVVAGAFVQADGLADVFNRHRIARRADGYHRIVCDLAHLHPFVTIGRSRSYRGKLFAREAIEWTFMIADKRYNSHSLGATIPDILCSILTLALSTRY